MPEAFAVGPLILPTVRIGSLLLFVAASWFAVRLAERFDLEFAWVESNSERTLILGFIGARLGFAMQNWQAYTAKPWTLLYAWQPGYSLLSGVFVGSAFLLWRVWTRPLSERPAYTAVFVRSYGLSLLLVFILLGSTHLNLGQNRLRVGQLAPDIHLQNLQGDVVRLADYAGNVVVLNFWATWCPPCRREIPMLEAMNNAYQGRGVVIIGIDVGESQDVVSRYINTMGVTYPIWVDGPQTEGLDSRALLRSFGGIGLPTTVFIDQAGIIRGFQVGELSAGLVQSQIESNLKRQKLQR